MSPAGSHRMDTNNYGETDNYQELLKSVVPFWGDHDTVLYSYSGIPGKHVFEGDASIQQGSPFPLNL